METQSTHLQKFFKYFEIIHGTLIPQYLKNLLDYCEYSEFTIRFFDEDKIRELEEFVKNEVSNIVSNEEWIRLTGEKFKESKRFVFFPPIKLLLLELAKFSRSTNILPKIFKTEVERSSSNEELSSEEATPDANMIREDANRKSTEENGGISSDSNNQPKRLKLESSVDFKEGGFFELLGTEYIFMFLSEELCAKLRYWFYQNYKEDPPINVQVFQQDGDSNILIARYVCHLCGSTIVFQNRDSRGWLRQNLYRHIRKHYEADKLTQSVEFNCSK